MQIRGSRGVLCRALLQRARNSRSQKVISNRLSGNTSTKNTSNKTSTSSTSLTTAQQEKLTLYDNAKKYAENIEETAESLLKLAQKAAKLEETDTDSETESAEEQTNTETAAAETTVDADETSTEESGTVSTQATKLAKQMVEEVETLVENYNKLRKSLSSIGGSAENMYSTRMKNIMISYKNKLSQVGITIDKKGQLEVDDDKLAAADIDTLTSIFGEEDGISSELKEQTSSICTYISSSAAALNKSYLLQNYNKYGMNSYAQNTGSYFNYFS